MRNMSCQKHLSRGIKRILYTESLTFRTRRCLSSGHSRGDGKHDLVVRKNSDDLPDLSPEAILKDPEKWGNRLNEIRNQIVGNTFSDPGRPSIGTNMNGRWWFWHVLFSLVPAAMIAVYCELVLQHDMIDYNRKTHIATQRELFGDEYDEANDLELQKIKPKFILKAKLLEGWNESLGLTDKSNEEQLMGGTDEGMRTDEESKSHGDKPREHLTLESLASKVEDLESLLQKERFLRQKQVQQSGIRNRAENRLSQSQQQQRPNEPEKEQHKDYFARIATFALETAASASEKIWVEVTKRSIKSKEENIDATNSIEHMQDPAPPQSVGSQKVAEKEVELPLIPDRVKSPNGSLEQKQKRWWLF